MVFLFICLISTCELRSQLPQANVDPHSTQAFPFPFLISHSFKRLPGLLVVTDIEWEHPKVYLISYTIFVLVRLSSYSFLTFPPRFVDLK